MRAGSLSGRDADTTTAARRWTALDFGTVLLLALPVLLVIGMAATWLMRLTDSSSTGGAHSALFASLEGTAAYVVETGLLLGLLWARHRTTLVDLGWVRPLQGWLLSALPIAAGLVLLSGQLGVISHELLPQAVNTQCTALRHTYAGSPLPAFLVAVIVAPICEETLFRGFVYAWLRSRMRWSYAVVISAGIFSLAHRSLLLAIPLVAAGVVLAYVYERSRSIWPGVLVHALFNLCGVLVILTAPGCG